jgi:hypothetical protein
MQKKGVDVTLARKGAFRKYDRMNEDRACYQNGGLEFAHKNSNRVSALMDCRDEIFCKLDSENKKYLEENETQNVLL